MTAKYDIIPIGKYKGQPIEQLMADQPYSEWLLALAAPVHRRFFGDDPATLYCSRMLQEVEPKGADLRVRFNGAQLMIEAKPLIGDDFPSVIRQVKTGMAGSDGSTTRAVVIARKVEPTNLSVAQVRRQFELAGVHLVLEDEFFEAGRNWAAQRAIFLQHAIAELEETIGDMRSRLVAAQAQTPDSGDEWSSNWAQKRDVDRLTSEIASAGDRLAQLRAAGADIAP